MEWNRHCEKLRLAFVDLQPLLRDEALVLVIAQAYGYRHLFTLRNLAAAGLLERGGGTARAGFITARKGLKLVVRLH